MSEAKDDRHRMFWYAIHLTPEWEDADGWRFTDDRGWAIIAMKILGLNVRVVAK